MKQFDKETPVALLKKVGRLFRKPVLSQPKKQEYQANKHPTNRVKNEHDLTSN